MLVAGTDEGDTVEQNLLAGRRPPAGKARSCASSSPDTADPSTLRRMPCVQIAGSQGDMRARRDLAATHGVLEWDSHG